MKTSTALVAALSLLSTSSALTIHKPRQTVAPPQYTVTIVTSDGVSNTLTSDTAGNVFDAFNPSVAFLASATINDPSLTAQCVTRDAQGNQVRGFGGPNFGDVESVQFAPADGEQIYTIACNIA